MLWVNLIMDSFGAIALATEPPTEALLRRKPHQKDDYIISSIMMKHIIGQSIFQFIIMQVVVFAGENFLFDIIGQRQIKSGSEYLVISGRKGDFDVDDYDEYSVHYTYVFNIFVFLQIFNFINSRILDDSFNVFANITKSNYFIWMVTIIVVL